MEIHGVPIYQPSEVWKPGWTKKKHTSDGFGGWSIPKKNGGIPGWRSDIWSPSVEPQWLEDMLIIEELITETCLKPNWHGFPVGCPGVQLWQQKVDRDHAQQHLGPMKLGVIITYSNLGWKRYYMLVGGLEHQFYFCIYWEFHHPN